MLKVLSDAELPALARAGTTGTTGGPCSDPASLLQAGVLAPERVSRTYSADSGEPAPRRRRHLGLAKLPEQMPPEQLTFALPP